MATQVCGLIADPTAKTVGTLSWGVQCDFGNQLLHLKAEEREEDIPTLRGRKLIMLVAS